jgi:hypothetical protein
VEEMKGALETQVGGGISQRKEPGWIDAWMYGCMDGLIDGWLDGWMNGLIECWMDGCLVGYLVFGCMGGCTHGWMYDGCMDAWMCGCTDVRMYGCTDECKNDRTHRERECIVYTHTNAPRRAS